MVALLKNASTLTRNPVLEDVLGLAAICVIIFAGLSLPALT